MSFFSDAGDEKRGHVSFDSQEVDAGAQLDASIRTPLDPGESLRIRRVGIRREHSVMLTI